MSKGTFDVAAKAAELIPEAVLVDGHNLRVNRSGDAMEKVMLLDTGDDKADDKTQARLAVSVLYTSLSYLLVDEDDTNPSPEWLRSRIDFEVASDLLGELMPGELPALPAEPVPEPPSTPGSDSSP